MAMKTSTIYCLVVQFHHLEKWWTSSMGLGWHPICEMENKQTTTQFSSMVFQVSTFIYPTGISLPSIATTFINRAPTWQKPSRSLFWWFIICSLKNIWKKMSSSRHEISPLQTLCFLCFCDQNPIGKSIGMDGPQVLILPRVVQKFESVRQRSRCPISRC